MTRRKRGTERARDERREGGPRYHGGPWHDHPQRVEQITEDPVPDVEGPAETIGVRRSHPRLGRRGRRQRDIVPA
jgi:hypothetical protein